MITENKTGVNISSVVEEAERFRENERLEYILYREEKNKRESYSIQAIQYKHGIKICQATACDVSSLYDAAKEMFDVVSEGYVEPYVLCDVIYDLMP